MQFSFGQLPCDNPFLYINFDDTNCLGHLSIDKISNPNNLWQIGSIVKPALDSAICHTRVIVTDTALPYAVNDTSVFLIRSLVTEGFYYGLRIFQGNYYVQTDSLNDYGKIEFSPDLGLTWLDMLDDTTFGASINWWERPVLTGHTGTCKHFSAVLGDLASQLNLQLGDTVLYRFTFISDSIYDNLPGIMYDNFHFTDFVEGISEIRFKPIKSIIYPNPGSVNFTVEFENPFSESFELSIYDINSKLLLKMDNNTDNKISFKAGSLKPGLYIYKLTNINARKRSWGKFIIAE